PYYAVELARALRPEAIRHGAPIHLPPSLHAAAADRVAAQPPGTRLALAAVARLADRDLAVLVALAMIPDLGPAEQAGIVTVDGHTVGFTHPLLGEAAHDGLVAAERLALRRRLADVTTGTARCIHLARSA